MRFVQVKVGKAVSRRFHGGGHIAIVELGCLAMGRTWNDIDAKYVLNQPFR